MRVLTALASSTSRQCEQRRGLRLEYLRDGDLCAVIGLCDCTTPPRSRTHWDDDDALDHGKDVGTAHGPLLVMRYNGVSGRTAAVR